MERYLYLSATPEALIASMLPPQEFGNYLAVGSEKRTRGQAIFFEVDMEKMKDQLPMDYIEKRCVPQKNNRPKRSVYIHICRVLEMVPLEALKSLYLTTDDGRVLELKKSEYQEDQSDIGLHLYQEITPVTPRVASTLNPRELASMMTDPLEQVRVPKLFFVELDLGDLANDPVNGTSKNLPYPNIDHLRDCLIHLKYEPQKIKKTVIRFFQGDSLYRVCKNGFFIGSNEEMLYYPLPGLKDLEEKHYIWWKSAISTGIR